MKTYQVSKGFTENRVFPRSVSVEELSTLEVNSHEERKPVLGFCDKEVIINFGECYFRSEFN